MPYITDRQREEFAELVDAMLTTVHIKNAGELNYLFTQLCVAYLCQNGANYQRYNDILGALEGAKLEAYRREIAPYEDEKKKLNGDVY